MQQVITIGTDGAVSGLQRKPGQGVDLRQFGRADIQRASEIVFCEDSQLWKVSILKGVYAGRDLSATLLLEASRKAHDLRAVVWQCTKVEETGTGVFLYAEYDTAVADEIVFLDTIRKADPGWL